MNHTDNMSNRVYECYICKAKGEWSEQWSWWGSIKDWDDGKPLILVCSKKCKAALDELGPEVEYKKLHAAAGVLKEKKVKAQPRKRTKEVDESILILRMAHEGDI